MEAAHPLTRYMPDSALARKLKLKPGARVAVLQAPAGYLKQLQPLPAGAKVTATLSGSFDWVRFL